MSTLSDGRRRLGRYWTHRVLPPLEQSNTRYPLDKKYDGNEFHDRSERNESKKSRLASMGLAWS